MAVTVVSTAGSPSANSYASIAEANAYVDGHVLNSEHRVMWEDADPEDLGRALIVATRNLDDMFTWYGRKTYSAGALDWPRMSVYDNYQMYSYDTIPTDVMHATVEYALWLLSNSTAFPQTQAAQYDAIEIGPIKIDYNEQAGGEAEKYIPSIISSLLAKFGQYTPASELSKNTIKMAKLVRS